MKKREQSRGRESQAKEERDGERERSSNSISPSFSFLSCRAAPSSLAPEHGPAGHSPTRDEGTLATSELVRCGSDDDNEEDEPGAEGTWSDAAAAAADDDDGIADPSEAVFEGCCSLPALTGLLCFPGAASSLPPPASDIFLGEQKKMRKEEAASGWKF